MTDARLIAATLRTRILTGEYAEGDPLPSLPEIAAEFHVSTMTARIAVAELRGGGLVIDRPGDNPQITPSRQVPAPRLVAEVLGIEQADMVALRSTGFSAVFTRLTH